MDNIRQIIAEEDGIRAEAASKIKAALKRNKNKPGIDAVKSLLNERIAAKKVQDELKDVFETEKKTRATTKLQTQKIEDDAATTIASILRGHKGRAKTARLKKFQDKTKDQTILSNIAQPTTNKRFNADTIEEPSFKRQLIKDTTTEDTVRDVVNDMVKRVEKSNALRKLNVPKVKKGRPVLKRQYDVKYIPQQKIIEMYNESKQAEINSNLQTRPLLGKKSSTNI